MILSNGEEYVNNFTFSQSFACVFCIGRNNCYITWI